MNEKMLNLTEKQCPVNELMNYAKSHKCADCGKCVFGYEGATQLELTMADISMKRSRATDMEQLKKLCQMMVEQGVEVSRRTVAKYRDELGIPSTAGRKTFG